MGSLVFHHRSGSESSGMQLTALYEVTSSFTSGKVGLCRAANIVFQKIVASPSLAKRKILGRRFFRVLRCNLGKDYKDMFICKELQYFECILSSFPCSVAHNYTQTYTKKFFITQTHKLTYSTDQIQY